MTFEPPEATPAREFSLTSDPRKEVGKVRDQSFPVWDGKRQDWEDYEEDVINFARHMNWDTDKFRKHLLMSIRDGSDAHRAVQPHWTMTQVLNHFRQSYSPKSPFVKQREFKRYRQTRGQTPQQYAMALGNLAKKAYGTFDSFVNIEALHVFFQGLLNRQMALHVMSHKPKNLAKAAELAMEFDGMLDVLAVDAENPAMYSLEVANPKQSEISEEPTSPMVVTCAAVQPGDKGSSRGKQWGGGFGAARGGSKAGDTTPPKPTTDSGRTIASPANPDPKSESKEDEKLSKSARRRRNLRFSGCFSCGELGHYAVDCTKQEAKTSAIVAACLQSLRELAPTEGRSENDLAPQ